MCSHAVLSPVIHKDLNFETYVISIISLSQMWNQVQGESLAQVI